MILQAESSIIRVNLMESEHKRSWYADQFVEDWAQISMGGLLSLPQLPGVPSVSTACQRLIGYLVGKILWLLSQLANKFKS